LSSLFFAKNLVHVFFKLRGLCFNSYNFLYPNMKNNSSSSFKFLLWESRNFFCRSKHLVLHFGCLNDYQRKLKLLIKNNSNFNVCVLLNSLNKEIQNWTKIYSNTDFYSVFAQQLDIYINKLLWHWAKRRHPRRSNSWIFSKYWKFVLSGWKFCTQVSIDGKIFFLKSHSFYKCKFYRLPLLFKVCNVFNISKFQLLWFNKTKILLNGLYFVLYYLQKGICPFCKRHFDIFFYPSLNIGYFPSRSVVKDFSVYNLLLFHPYCTTI